MLCSYGMLEQSQVFKAGNHLSYVIHYAPTSLPSQHNKHTHTHLQIKIIDLHVVFSELQNKAL